MLDLDQNVQSEAYYYIDAEELDAILAEERWDAMEQAWGDVDDDDQGDQDDQEEQGHGRALPDDRQVRASSLLALWPTEFPELPGVVADGWWWDYTVGGQLWARPQPLIEQVSGVIAAMHAAVLARLAACGTDAASAYSTAGEVRLFAELARRHYQILAWYMCESISHLDEGAGLVWLRANLYGHPNYQRWDQARLAAYKGTEVYRAKQQAYDRDRNKTEARRAADRERKRQRRAARKAAGVSAP